MTIRFRWFVPAFGSFLIAFGCGDDKTPDPDLCGEPGMICTVVGVPDFAGYNGDSLALDETHLYWPHDVTLSPSGELIVVDFNNHRVRAVNLTTKTIRTILGSGVLGDDAAGPALEIDINHPAHVTFDGQGRLHLSSFHNWKVRRMSTGGFVETIAGSVQGFGGDGGPAALALFDLPSSSRFDGLGNLYISDQGNGRIRRINPAGTIVTYAGTGEQGYGGDDGPAVLATFDMPSGPDAVPCGKIDIGPDLDEIYVADTGNHRVREINLASGIIETVAGTGVPGYSGDGGPSDEAQLNYPTDVAVGPDHSVYICDSRNHVIRRIDPLGTISTVAGNFQKGRGYSGDEGPATEAQLDFPGGIFVSPDNILYIADTQNHLIRRVELP
jgi:sugar lactone lactonase YvrE